MIAFLIYDISICGGTHKQLLKLLDYTASLGMEYMVVAKDVNLQMTYPGFMKHRDRITEYKPVRPFLFRIKGLRKYYKLYNSYRLKWILRKADIINIHDSGWEDEIPLFKGKRVYWQVNDLPGCFAEGASAHKVSREDMCEQEKILSNIKYITDFTVNVGKNAERIKRVFQRDAHVFYCGIEPVGVERNIDESLRRFSGRRVNLLSSGVFLTYRNYETQIDVVKLLIQEGIDVSLHIIGRRLDSEYADRIQRMIDHAGLENVITIEGQVDDIKFKELHRDSDIFLFINIDQSWGLAVFEAMSCGLPVIVSKSVGATEILHDGIDSLFVDPLDSQQICRIVMTLMENEDYYRRISGRASSFHEKWTWNDVYCSKMIELFSTRL